LEVLEGGQVLLDEDSGWEHGPQLLADVERIGRRIHVLFERIYPRRFTGRGTVGRSSAPANQSSFT
jgi:hypothetical protein